jgi:hypothetical protein
MGKDHSRQISQLRRNLVKASQTDRNAILEPMSRYSESIEQTSKLFQSPQQVLSRAGLGDARRSELQRQLQGAGPGTLRSMAELALAQV